jgi:hypothetical protein
MWASVKMFKAKKEREKIKFYFYHNIYFWCTLTDRKSWGKILQKSIFLKTKIFEQSTQRWWDGLMRE